MFLQAIVYVMAVSSTQAGPLLATNKLTLADWGSYNHREHKGPGTYAYGYDIEDPVTGNIQFKQEERHLNGTVTGSYGYVEADGKPRVLHYISDHNGYRVRLISEPTVIQHDPEVANFPVNNIIQEDEIPLQKPSMVQLPPVVPVGGNNINDDFGNDIALGIQQTHPSFDQKKRIPVRNNVIRNPSPLIYTYKGGIPVFGFSSPNGISQGKLIYYRV